MIYRKQALRAQVAEHDVNFHVDQFEQATAEHGAGNIGQLLKLTCLFIVGGVHGVFQLLLLALGQAFKLLPGAVHHGGVAIGQHVLHGVYFQHAAFKQVGTVNVG